MERSPLVPSTVAAADEQSLARDMIEVHGTEAATIARANARAAVLAAQTAQAKSWIRVLGIIQRDRADKARSPAGEQIAAISAGPTRSPRIATVYISLINRRANGFKNGRMLTRRARNCMAAGIMAGSARRFRHEPFTTLIGQPASAASETTQACIGGAG